MRRTNLRPIIVREIDRLVISKAAWLTKRYGLQSADQQDIRQEGWIAALRALPRYNREMGSLATYLTPRILFHMLNSILRAQTRGLTGTAGGPEALEDVESVGSFEPVDDSEDAGADIALSPVSLADLLADPGQEDALLAVADATGALARLGTRERNLLILYFGLAGEAPMTLKDLARRNRQPIGVIYRRIQRGLDMLKDDLEQGDTAE